MCVPKPKTPKPRQEERDPLLASEVLRGRIRARASQGFRGATSTVIGAEPGQGGRITPAKTLLGQ